MAYVTYIMSVCVYSEVRCSSLVEHPLMVQWVIRSIPHGGPTELFLVPASTPDRQTVQPDYYNKGRGMCYPVCDMVYINTSCC